MKRYISGLLFGMFVAANASAEAVTFDFTGMVNSTHEYNSLTSRSKAVPGSSMNGTFIVPGNTFHGTFTLDLSTPLASLNPASGNAWYNPGFNWNATAPVYQNAMSLTFDQSGYTSASETGPYSSSSISVTDKQPGAGYDSFAFFPSGSSKPGAYEYLSLFMFDSQGMLLTSTAIPHSFDLNAVDSTTITYSYLPRGSTKSLSVDGFLTSLTARTVSPVPEPTTYLMLGLGLLVVGAASVRQHRRS